MLFLESSNSGHQLLFIKNDKIESSSFLNETQKNWLVSKKEQGIQQAVFHTDNGTLLVYTLAEKEKDSKESRLEKVRQQGYSAWKNIAELRLEDIHFQAEGIKNKYVYAFLEGLLLSTYKFRKYKKPDAKAFEFKGISLSEDSLKTASVQKLETLVACVFAARDLVNEPVSTLDTPTLAKRAKEIGEASCVKVTLLSADEITALGMGGVLGVNKGSANPPEFIIMEWTPENLLVETPLVLVGKGVAYDTGGYSIKTSGMETMKCDMGGAAVVIAGLKAAALLNVPYKVVGLVPVVENRVNEHAIVPGDILTMSDGTTVEVLNTDAEGRLILADALVYAKKFNPMLVLDFATLTGAAVRAIGNSGIVYMGTADKKIKRIAENSGEWTYERLVEFPLWEEYRDQLKSDIADISNLGGPLAGASTAGKFLEHFTDYPWLHFDIAGPAFLQHNGSYRGSGGTGAGVRWLIDFYYNFEKEWLEEQKN